MESENKEILKQTAESMAGMRLPRWKDLPDLDIYMDQVLSLISRYFGDYPGFDSKGLTSSMVNNYVKLGIIPPPVKKKYDRVHLAYLIMICVLKSVLPISLVSRMISEKAEGGCTYAEIYDSFCTAFESSVSSAATGKMPEERTDRTDAAFRAALNAHAEQTFVTCIMQGEDL
jgi:hypothetical protein